MDLKTRTHHETLLGLGYIFIPNLMSEDEITLIISEFENAKNGNLTPSEINLNDSDDKANVVYQSRRSQMQYCYLKSEPALKIGSRASQRLTKCIGISWGKNIDATVLPIFEYSENGFIKEHRDRDIGFGANNYICPVLLTTPEEDFLRGRFFLNEHASVSKNGKEVFGEDTNKRIYFEQEFGSGIVFDNQRFIHGTEPISRTKTGRAKRITVSFRSS